MFRDILVLLDDDGELAGPFALSLGRQLDAFVSGICVRPLAMAESLDPADVAYATQFLPPLLPPAPVLAVAPATFKQDLVSARFGGELTILSDLPDHTDREIAALCRFHDLIVVEQPTPDRSKPTDRHLGTILLRTGRPCLIVPYVSSEPAFLRKITVAWDGSQVAARALGDALPLLGRADHVDIVRVVAEYCGEDERESGAALVRHLERHGIIAAYHQLPSGIPVADALLSHVADTGSDLLVMGAYGHSRLREAVLGGASRVVLASMTLPVFMSH